MDKFTTYCDCSDPAHSMEFNLFLQEGEEPELFVSVQLNQLHPWWKRLRYGLMYVLGKRSRLSYGHWDEGGISYASTKELIVLLSRFVATYNEFSQNKSSKIEVEWKGESLCTLYQIGQSVGIGRSFKQACSFISGLRRKVAL